MYSPIPQDVSLKDHMDSRFDGLEKLIDAKFEKVESTAKTQMETLTALEGRVSSLERWRAYILGACLIIGFLIQWVCEKLF